MPDTIALSNAAVAVFRLRMKGCRIRVSERTLDAYRDLAAAGIMEPVPDAAGNPEVDFRFTTDDRVRREDWLRAAEAHQRSLEPRLPERIDLSDAAQDVLGRRLAGDENVTAQNRPAYRELARAGIMFPVSTFAGGPESLYKFTSQGWERRHEFHRPLRRRSASAMARSLSLAVSRILRGVSAAR
jgi:hypothetical protein